MAFSITSFSTSCVFYYFFVEHSLWASPTKIKSVALRSGDLGVHLKLPKREIKGCSLSVQRFAATTYSSVQITSFPGRKSLFHRKSIGQSLSQRKRRDIMSSQEKILNFMIPRICYFARLHSIKMEISFASSWFWYLICIW